MNEIHFFYVVWSWFCFWCFLHYFINHDSNREYYATHLSTGIVYQNIRLCHCSSFSFIQKGVNNRGWNIKMSTWILFDNLFFLGVPKSNWDVFLKIDWNLKSSAECRSSFALSLLQMKFSEIYFILLWAAWSILLQDTTNV